MSLGTAVRVFQSTEYRISASTQADVLSIEVAGPFQTFASKFTARFIEEVTQRTGSPRTFATFCRMLSSALTGTPSVTLDLLSSEDLDRLRGKSSSTPTRESEKRFLIVTYIGEFDDKVHYPLALSDSQAGSSFRPQTGVVTSTSPPSSYPSTQPCSNPHCMSTISTLQSHLNSALARESSTRSEFQSLVDSFQCERNRLVQTEQSELAALRESNRFFESELKILREGRAKTATRHKKEVEDLQRELNGLKHDIRQAKLKIKGLEEDLRNGGGRFAQGNRRPGWNTGNSPNRSGLVQSSARSPSPSRYDTHRDDSHRGSSTSMVLGSARGSGVAPPSPVRRAPMLAVPQLPLSRTSSPRRQSDKSWTASSRAYSPVRSVNQQSSPRSHQHSSRQPFDSTPHQVAQLVATQSRPSSSILQPIENVMSSAAPSVKDIDARLQALQQFLRQTKAGL